QFIEFLQDFSVLIIGFGFLQNFSVPKNIVGENDSSGIHFSQNLFVIMYVIGLVGIDENQIKFFVQIIQNIQRISNSEFNLLRVFGFGKIFSWEIHQFFISIDGDDFPFF